MSEPSWISPPAIADGRPPDVVILGLASLRGSGCAADGSRTSRCGIAELTTPDWVPIGTAPVGTAIARLWRSFLKWLTARSVNSARLPPLTTVSPSGLTSRLSVVRSWRRYPDFSRKPMYSAERDRDRAFADPPDVVVAVLAAVARLRHDVGENEAGLLAEDFLRDLGAAFHPTNCRHPRQLGSIRRDALYAQPFDERPVRRQDVPVRQVGRRDPREVGDLDARGAPSPGAPPEPAMIRHT